MEVIAKTSASSLKISFQNIIFQLHFRVMIMWSHKDVKVAGIVSRLINVAESEYNKQLTLYISFCGKVSRGCVTKCFKCWIH